MSLADELAATNQLLRESIQTPPPEAPAPIHRPSSRTPTPIAATSFLLAAHTYSGMNILGNHFRDVPEQHVTRDGKDATVACSCGQRLEMSFGQLAKCACSRWYYNGNGVKWAPAPEPHTCQPNANGWCDECGEDFIG